jgi:apolipoprotein N-acyltransferase
LPPDELETARDGHQTRSPYRFQFSLSQFLITITCAALLFGFIQILGGPSNAATLCGFFALGGLVVHALGYEPPEVVAFVWWIMLLMYVGLSVFAAIWSGIAG